MIKDFYVKTNVESKSGKICGVTNQFTSVEEACSYMRRVNREYASLKYHGIIKSYNIQCVSIASEKKPLEYYYNYCYSVEEVGDFV